MTGPHRRAASEFRARWPVPDAGTTAGSNRRRRERLLPGAGIAPVGIGVAAVGVGPERRRRRRSRPGRRRCRRRSAGAASPPSESAGAASLPSESVGAASPPSESVGAASLPSESVGAASPSLEPSESVPGHAVGQRGARHHGAGGDRPPEKRPAIELATADVFVGEGQRRLRHVRGGLRARPDIHECLLGYEDETQCHNSGACRTRQSGVVGLAACGKSHAAFERRSSIATLAPVVAELLRPGSGGPAAPEWPGTLPS